MRGIVRLAFVAGSAATLAAGATVGALGQLARQQAEWERARPAEVSAFQGLPLPMPRFNIGLVNGKPGDLADLRQSVR